MRKKRTWITKNEGKTKKLNEIDKLIEEAEDKGDYKMVTSLTIKRNNIEDDYKISSPFRHYKGTIK